jgi:hypothetical protein
MRLLQTEPAAVATIAGGLLLIGLADRLRLDGPSTLAVALALWAICTLLTRAAVHPPAQHRQALAEAFDYGLAAGFRSAVSDARLKPTVHQPLEGHDDA